MKLTPNQKLKKWKLNARFLNKLNRIRSMPPLYKKEYVFLKELYMYLSKQVLTQEFKDNLYINYTELVDTCYFPNRETICFPMVETLYLQGLNILEREYNGPVTFIILNNENHYLKMRKILELLYNWSLNPEYYGFASEPEFWEAMEFLRKEFNKTKIDIEYQVGKWPRKFRKRRIRK
jgi:hypothetical protein